MQGSNPLTKYYFPIFSIPLQSSGQCRRVEGVYRTSCAGFGQTFYLLLELGNQEGLGPNQMPDARGSEEVRGRWF